MRSFLHWLRKSALVRVLAGFALAALVLAGVGWLVTGPYREYPASFDSSVRNAIRQMQSPMWTSLFLTATKLGSTLYLAIVGAIAGAVFIFLRMFRSVWLLVIVMTGQAILHYGAKWLFARPRPPVLISYKAVENFSFPSGHAIATLSLYFMIAWIVCTQLENPAIKIAIWIFTALLVFLVGCSRVYIGIHFPTDVLAGFLASLIWTGAVMLADRREL